MLPPQIIVQANDISDHIPSADYHLFKERTTRYCVVIPVINENGRLTMQIRRMHELGLPRLADIIIADGGSHDGSTDHASLKSCGVRALLVIKHAGGQSAQLRAGYAYCLSEGYEGVITVDGNNKDSIESLPLFISALDKGMDYVQGSRFQHGGEGINTPFLRTMSIRLIHAPLVSFAARKWLTDTTNGYRAYSRRYLLHPQVKPFRTIFRTYELNHYLSVRASRIGLSVMEVPVTRKYPRNGPVPTKISPVMGKIAFLKMLFLLLAGWYNP